MLWNFFKINDILSMDTDALGNYIISFLYPEYICGRYYT